jgi:hypothetical protein
VRKRAWEKDAQNSFLNCLLPKEIASTIDSHIGEIEMEVLHASWTSEFSHSLGQKRKSNWPTPTSALPLKADIRQAGWDVR